MDRVHKLRRVGHDDLVRVPLENVEIDRGNKRVTQRGLKVVRIDADRNLLLVQGSVPGPKNGLVEVRTDA